MHYWRVCSQRRCYAQCRRRTRQGDAERAKTTTVSNPAFDPERRGDDFERLPAAGAEQQTGSSAQPTPRVLTPWTMAEPGSYHAL